MRRPLSQADTREAPAQPARGQHLWLKALVDAGVLSGASPAGVVWQWVRIDSQVVRAIDFNVDWLQGLSHVEAGNSLEAALADTAANAGAAAPVPVVAVALAG